MNLSKFLSLVDEICREKSREELEIFIHEWARGLTAESREEFLRVFRSASKVKLPIEKEVHKHFLETYSKIKSELSAIENEELTLKSEINEEYDDWYNSSADEFLFFDESGIGRIVQNACRFLQECVDEGEYEIGCELAEILMGLEISVEGDYQDYVGEPLDMKELPGYGIAHINFQSVLICALYAAYQTFPLEDRPSVLYRIMSEYASYAVKLEEVMQIGEELPEFDAFLKLWIEYLGRHSNSLTQRLLKEALELSNDEEVLLESARKYVNTHPGLYEQWISSQMPIALREKNTAEKLYAVGQEALVVIDDKYIVRSRIADMMLKLAEVMEKAEDEDACMMEAFRSDSSAANYMRIRLDCHDYSKYKNEVTEICRGHYLKNRTNEFYPVRAIGELAENTVGRDTAYMLAFFEEEFAFVLNQAMNIKQALGWSSTFMKCGLAAFLLMLFDAETIQVGGKSMCRLVISHVGNLNCENAFEENREKDKAADFWKRFLKWKQCISLSEEQRAEYTERMEKLVEMRVRGIMDANRRNYYGECAAYVAALGEVKESNGVPGGKQMVMEHYRSMYSRRSAFHQELREYGMIRKK